MRRVRTSDGSLVVGERFGDTAAWAHQTPLVLLHGLSQQRHFWGPVIARLPGVPIVALDLRGHGDADVSLDTNFDVSRCATDVWEFLDDDGIETATIVGHSWGASVALAAAAQMPKRTASAAMIDGAVVVPFHLGSRSEVRAMLTPPNINMASMEDITEMIQASFGEENWSAEIAAAIAPTFTQSSSGYWTTRLGFERHMAVLDAFLDYDPAADWAGIICPTWLITCESHGKWEYARNRRLTELPQRDNFYLQQWGGAIHDVPLQWPSLVAGLLDTVWQRGMRP